MGLSGSVRRGLIGGLVAVFLLALLPPATARSRRHRKPNPIKIVLEPFLVAHSVVHAVAQPIATLAIAPVRVAYHNVHDHEPGALRGAIVQEEESAHFSQPFRVAYLAPRAEKPNQPSASEDDEEDSDFPRAKTEPENHRDGPTVAGKRAILRHGIAYAPSRAPQRVKNAIWAVNGLRRKPYVWGGGHGSFYDRGYDCSGTVSFALHGASAIAFPLPSSDFMRYGERGRGRWVTIYARPGHTFAIVAGLRLDTTDFRNGGNSGPRWHSDLRDTRGYVARHPAGL